MLREASYCAVFDDRNDCEWLLETEARAHRGIGDESYYTRPPTQHSRARIVRIACHGNIIRLHCGRKASFFATMSIEAVIRCVIFRALNPGYLAFSQNA